MKQNLTKEEKRSLKQLGENKDIVIRQANKGGGIVLQNYGNYNAEAMKILSDRNYYNIIEKDPFIQLEKSFLNFIKTVCDQSIITKEEFKHEKEGSPLTSTIQPGMSDYPTM